MGDRALVGEGGAGAAAGIDVDVAGGGGGGAERQGAVGAVDINVGPRAEGEGLAGERADLLPVKPGVVPERGGGAREHGAAGELNVGVGREAEIVGERGAIEITATRGERERASRDGAAGDGATVKFEAA